MNSARLASSPRLRRTLMLFEHEKRWLTTRQIVRGASVCAVSSVIAELRCNGCVIECSRRTVGGVSRHGYELVSAPKGWRDRK